eukprot:830014_1
MMESLLEWILLFVSLATSIIRACKTVYDCSLGGKCVNNECICDPTWYGDDCGQLNLLPATNYKAYYHETESSWGGSVVYNSTSKQYHMFVSDMSYNCTLNQW